MTISETVSKADFAALCNVAPSRVSHWIKDGKISGDALVGTGRAARIVVALAREQLRKRLDISQRLGNGAETVLNHAPAYTHSGTPEQRECRLLQILSELPAAVTNALERTGVSAAVRFSAFHWCKITITSELDRYYPILAFDEPDWVEIAAETNEPVDVVGWTALAEQTMWSLSRDKT